MSAISHVNTEQRWSYATTASLVIAAWLALAVWSLSSYAEWLDHARMDEIAAPLFVRLAVFILGWTLMVIAMMLPGTLRVVRGLDNRPLSAHRIALFLLAYLTIWTIFGGFSYWGDTLLHEVVEQVPALAGVIAPVVLLLAGIYELTPMKRFCLSKCRPESAVFKTSGPSSRRALWMMGLRHGEFCLGSCWALMLLMFAIGGVNLFWMLILSVIMTVERLSPRGDTVAQGLGVVLIIVSVLWVIV